MKTPPENIDRRRGSEWIRAGRAIVLALLTILAINSAPAGEPGMVPLGGKCIAAGWKSSWSPDGRELVFGGKVNPGKDEVTAGLLVLDLASGMTRVLAEGGKDPAWSPGEGRHIAYVAGKGGEDEEVWICDRDGGNPHKLADGGFPSWGPDPGLLFYQSRKLGRMMSIRLDAPVPVEGIRMRWWYPVVSRDARHVAYRAGGQIRVADLRTGEVLRRVPLREGRGFLGGWSPCGRYLCFGGYGAHDVIGLNLVDLKTEELSRIAGGNFTMAEWSRDGTRIAVDHRQPGKRELFLFEAAALGDLVEKPQRGNADPKLIRGLVRQLDDESFRIREEASRMLLEIGDAARESLREALDDPGTGAELQLRVRELLEQIGSAAPFGG